MRKYILITIILSIGMLFNMAGLATVQTNIPALLTRKKRIQPSFAIYATKINGKDLNKAKLLEPPLLTEKDIIAYEWTDHSMKITPGATARLAKILKASISGVPFVVVTNGKRCYKGAFWWSISSIATPSPVLMADSLNAEDKNGAILRFQNGYPSITTAKEKISAFENKSVWNVLMRTRKLTRNGLVIFPSGFHSSWRMGEYRTRMTNEDQTKSDAAYKKIYHRYGREDYKSLRDELLSQEHAFTFPGEFVATVRIFHEANDKESLIKALGKLNPKVIRDSNTWEQIDNISHRNGIKVYQAFIMTCDPKIYYPVHFSSFQNAYIELLATGKASKADRVAVEKMVDMAPELYARFCQPLKRDKKICMANINRKIVKNKTNTVKCRKLINRMMSFVSYYRNHVLTSKTKPNTYLELEKFLCLLDLNNELDFSNYVEAASVLGMYSQIADLLIKRINLPVSYYELEMSTFHCNRFMSQKEKHEIATERRRGQLIDYLLKAKRIKEAQVWAEKFYGANADLNKIRSRAWKRIGMTQRLSGARVFEDKLKKTEPKAGTWNFYQKKYQYYLGRKDEKKALQTLHEAIEKGKKLKKHEMVVFASDRLCDFYWRKKERRKGRRRKGDWQTGRWRKVEWRKALDIARKNNAYVVKNVHSGKKIISMGSQHIGTQARMFAAKRLLEILQKTKLPGWEHEWEKVARREFLDGQTYLLHTFLSGKRCVDKNYTMSAKDEIFNIFCSDAFQKKNGFCAIAHGIRLAAVPFEDFENCLKQTLDDFEKYKRSKDIKPRRLGWALYNAPQKAEREALLAKYLFDRYPKTFWYYFDRSITVRDYREGKTLLEKYWNSGEIEPRIRHKALTALLKKAPNRTEKRWCEKELAKLGKSKK
ncbi:MAG: hypothetical protein KOO69_08420 [Victivallales bacterium]|nr:hypothetical protein [Victivallales bacterium]